MEHCVRGNLTIDTPGNSSRYSENMENFKELIGRCGNYWRYSELFKET
jgi:hypothetical protein